MKRTMAYFNMTNARPDAVDGVDIGRSKSINMIGWEQELVQRPQKQDSLVNAMAAVDDHGAVATLSEP